MFVIKWKEPNIETCVCVSREIDTYWLHLRHRFTIIIVNLSFTALQLVIQVDTNIVLPFLIFNKKQRQNDTCVTKWKSLFCGPCFPVLRKKPETTGRGFSCGDETWAYHASARHSPGRRTSAHFTSLGFGGALQSKRVARLDLSGCSSRRVRCVTCDYVAK